MIKSNFTYVDDSAPELQKIEEYWRSNLFKYTPRFANREYGIRITLKYKNKKYKLIGIAADELEPYMPITNKVVELLKEIGCKDINVFLERGLHD